MNANVKEVYKNFAENNFINYDEKQIKILKIVDETLKKNNKINFFSKSIKNNGIYLYGSVGIGKTFILNLFIQNIKKAKKIHFNHFMINLHASINNDKKIDLEGYIKNFVKNYNVIFIDELHIFNIVDALLIKKIFILFQKFKVFILLSSNFRPIELYKNGLQRSDFIPFIDYINKNFKILHLENMNDYRRQMLNQSKTYFSPINETTSKEFNKLFEKFVDKNQIHIKRIKIKSRTIRFEKCTSNIAFCSFKEICETNLGHEDYLNISKIFSLIFIEKIPFFTNTEIDECRRFISLIDMLYEQKCSVVILASKPINQLCEIRSLNKEFERTASRLYEMTIINTLNK